MTDFSNLLVEHKDYVALQNFWHVTNGIYLWEWITTLDFELDIIRGRRSYRSTIWIYSLARTALLISISLNFVDLNVTTETVNCQTLVTFQVVVAYVGLVSASLLVTIRIIAIWNRNKFAVAFAIIILLINVSVVVQGVARLRASWDPAAQTCNIDNSEEIKPTLIITVITDIILLVTMLVGLVRLLTGSSSGFGLGHLLLKQGIIWLLVATIAGIPPTVFIFFNLNVPFNLMFQLPSVITNTIAATRIYRSLADYSFASTKAPSDTDPSKYITKASELKWKNPTPIPLSRIEVAVDTSYEQYPSSRTTLGVPMDAQQGDRPHELNVGSDLPVEIGIAK